jgi:hypothetical protein
MSEICKNGTKAYVMQLEQENADLKRQVKAMRGALEELKALFPDIFECVSSDDCLKSNCGETYMCRQMALIINKALEGK